MKQHITGRKDETCQYHKFGIKTFSTSLERGICVKFQVL